MKKPIRVVLLGDAEKSYKNLNSIVGQQKKKRKENTEEMQLLKSISQKIGFIKANPFYGDSIKKDLIPKEYIKNYNVSNLFRVELSQFWRMLYTVKGDQIEIVCFILDILNHPSYDKILGYKKR
ncbi:hypothetical protein HYT24_01155 [Candidatus Pacearchaeota archaeon]|nr:hypothetical protein [Candidatus Pacearchaeota archaeon]